MKMVSIFGSVAQLVERTTENREVTGSTPVGATTKPPRNRGLFCPRGVPTPRSEGGYLAGERPQRLNNQSVVVLLGNSTDNDRTHHNVIDNQRIATTGGSEVDL